MLNEQQQNIAKFAAGEIGKIMASHQATTQQISEAVEHLDMNVLSMSEVLLEVFGQLTQIDTFLRRLAEKHCISLDLSDGELSIIKAEGQKWFDDVVRSSFVRVHQKREEEDRRRAEEVQKAKEEAEKAAKAKDEAERMEQELRASEQKGEIQQISGGQGVAIPEGADVFGG